MGEEKKGNDAKMHKEEYVLKLEEELHELEKREESSTRRMQLLVYPSMVAFIILAAYGFYLVNSLTKDVHRMADSVYNMSLTVKINMDIISDNTTKMSSQMRDLVDNTRDMNKNMTELVGTTGKMSTSVDYLSTYTGNMQQDMWSLNRSISKPLNMFNQFIPWSSNSGSSYSRPPVYYPQYQRYQQQSAKSMPSVIPQEKTVNETTIIPAPSDATSN